MVRVPQAVTLAQGEGAAVPNPVGGRIVFKVRGEQTDGKFTAFESEIAPGDGPPLHVHAGEDETLYVASGEFRFKLGAEMVAAPAGTFVHVPKGVPHCFQNVAKTPGWLLVTFTPAGMEHFFDQFAAAETRDAGSFKSIGSTFGMEVVGPPLAQSDPV